MSLSALSDSKPVPGTGGKLHEVSVAVRDWGATQLEIAAEMHKDENGFFSDKPLRSMEDAKKALRAQSEQMILPRLAEPRFIENVGDNPIMPGERAEITGFGGEVIRVHRPVDVHFTEPVTWLSPDGTKTPLTVRLSDGVLFDWSDVSLPELRRHRDRLNEVIYDKEQGKG